jgi:hypothetical protein
MKKFTVLVILLLSASRIMAVAPIDSVDTYTNHTVSDSVFVQGRTSLTVSNVNVTSTGRLRLSAPESVLITGGFTVNPGGTLNIYEEPIYRIRLSYDATGNVIRRQEETLFR